MGNKICVYAICKNEAKFVDKWYESMKEADSIVVLDTGSSDKTVEKLKEKGVKVAVKEIKPWRFDVARNESLKLCPKDCNILVCTDLDEVFEKGWAKLLRENWVEGKHKRCKYKYIWSHLSNGTPGKTFFYNKIHNRGWKWNFPVHEILYDFENKTGGYRKIDELDLFDKIVLHHYPDNKKKRSNYTKLLELREKENPTDDTLGALELCQAYYFDGKYEQCITKCEEKLDVYKKTMNPGEKSHLFKIIGDCYVKMNRRQDAIKNYSNGIRTDVSYMDNYLGISEAYLELYEYQNAVKAVKAGLKYAKQKFVWYEGDISFSYLPYFLLSKGYFGLNKKVEALGCAVKAFSYNPNDEELVNKVYDTINSMLPIDY